MPPETVVFFHAHPDDEAIFTGGTIALLAQKGVRVVVVFATTGEMGEIRGDLETGETLAERRARESRVAADILGVAHSVFLGYRDSGLPGDPANDAPESFAAVEAEAAADHLAGVLEPEAPAAIVVYDAGGIYGHPDHIHVHRVGVRAAEILGIPTIYQATVDREYLHFVETHLVGEAAGSPNAVVPMPTVGVPTVFVTTTVDVRSVLDRKRRAIAAHSSQVPETSSAMSLSAAAFAGVYGYEWYVREGPGGAHRGGLKPFVRLYRRAIRHVTLRARNGRASGTRARGIGAMQPVVQVV
ncbi:MAG: PIG-L family deacetylase [Actinobacteria bacterium]|nr:PIG-L family deacetylase [Actinomycetota bacterium]